jgi:autotransporter-associated beta strand protein
LPFNFLVNNTSIFNNGSATLTKTGGGTLTFAAAGSQLDVRNGTLDLQDGMIETTSSLVIGSGGGTAAATVSGGTLKTGYLEAANLIVGYGAGAGTLTQSGGTIEVGSGASVVIGWEAGSSGVYTLEGGSFAGNTNNTFIGYVGGTGTVNVNGGSFVPHNLIVGGNGAAAGTLNLNGGSFDVAGTFTVAAAGTVNLNAAGVMPAVNVTVGNGGLFNFNGGTGNASMNLLASGGTVDLQGQTIGEGTWANVIAHGTGGVLRNSGPEAATIANGNTIWIWDGGQNLIIDTSAGDIQIDAWITSAGQTTPTGLIKTGAGNLVLTYPANTYTGDTVVDEGTLELSSTGSLIFTVGSNGVNSSLQGRGSAVLDGTCNFNLANASTNNGDSWTIVEPSLDASYGPNFRIARFSGRNGIWTKAFNGVTYRFEQSTGVLSVSTDAAEPTLFARLAAGGVLKWIWPKEPGEPVSADAPQGKVRFRRAFELPADGMPDWGEFIFAVDNFADVFINGQYLGKFSGWIPQTHLDITRWLRPGRNVIAVEVENSAAGPAGFIGVVELGGRSPVLFDTDTKSAPEDAGSADWTDSAFDDSSWTAATVLIPADLGPWGRISGPPPENPTLQTIPENFPVFTVPGFAAEMDQMRQILFGHYRLDLSNLPSFNLQWIAPAAIWAGLDARPADSWTRASLRARLLSMRVMADGYVSCHQHEGLGHSEGWPFPLYTQSGGAGWMFSTAGLLYGPELGVVPATDITNWTFRRATATSLDVIGGLRLSLTGADADMTSPPINVNPQAATWIRIKLIPGPTPLQPYVQWRTAAAGFSEARKVAFEIPADATPGVPVDVDVPIHPLASGGDNITRLRVGFGNTDNGEVTILRVFTAVDTRHNWNNANFVLAAATYFNWTGDVDFLRGHIDTLRRIFRYSMEEFVVRRHGVIFTPWAGKDGRSGLTIGADGTKTINYGLGAGTNYWDLLPFGGKDGHSTIYQFAAVRAMEQLEAAVAARPEWNIRPPAPEYGAEALAGDLAAMRAAYTATFWKPDQGRFGGAVDSTGKLWDYGFTFLNNEAMYYGLTEPAQERQIVDWLSGARTIAGETSAGADLYRFRFGPRATTMRNLDYYNYAWTSPELLSFGGQVQDGGAVFGFSFHDLMGRLRVNGPDDAWARLKEILAWFGEVQSEGGYRKYYAPETAAERGSLQGGGTAGGLGIDEEFYETLLVPLIMTEGFLGLSVSPDRIRFAPRLPREWPSLEVGRIQYRDWMLRAKATAYSVELDLEANATAVPIEVEIGAGRWNVQVLDAQGGVLRTQAAGAEEGTTVLVDDPESRRLVATRAPELNVWLPVGPGDWNEPSRWHLNVVPGGTQSPLLNTGGTAYLTSPAPSLFGAAFVGQGAGDGTLEIRGGGSLTLAQLFLGRDSARTGLLVVNGGALAVEDLLYVGDGVDGSGGSGTFHLVSGAVNVGGDLFLGSRAGTSGSVVVEGGALTATQLRVGNLGAGTFSQTGGLFTLTGPVLVLAEDSAASGTFELQGGTLDAAGAVIQVGGDGSGTGSFVLSGGTLQAAGVVVRSGSSFADRGGTLDVAATMTNHGTWIFNPPDSLTRSYHLTGTGAVTKTGTGMLTLAGSNAYAGATTVEAGSLVIDGNHSAAMGDVIVRTGAALGGGGTLGGSLVLEPGARWVLHPPSTLTVAGAISGGFTLAQVEGLEAGLPAGRYTLINGEVDPSQFSPVGASSAQDIGGGDLAWFEADGGSLALVVSAATSSFGEWLQQFGLSGAAADPAAAPAGDGISNLLKYAFNLDPLRHEGTGQFPGEYRGLPYLEAAAGGDLQMIYYRDPARSGIHVMPVWTTELSEAAFWDEVPNRRMIGTQGGIEAWRARLPMDGGQGFMRIEVEVE